MTIRTEIAVDGAVVSVWEGPHLVTFCGADYTAVRSVETDHGKDGITSAFVQQTEAGNADHMNQTLRRFRRELVPRP